MSDGEFNWFSELTEDQTDPATPLFWETVYWLAKQGQDLEIPKEVALPEPSFGVQVLELQRAVAIKTPTMAMEILTDQ